MIVLSAHTELQKEKSTTVSPTKLTPSYFNIVFPLDSYKKRTQRMHNITNVPFFDVKISFLKMQYALQCK